MLESLGPHLLVAEDLEDARTTLQQLLHLSLGLDVDVAEDGQKALQMLEQRPYSILVTDLRMPKLGGLKLMEQIETRTLRELKKRDPWLELSWQDFVDLCETYQVSFL